MTLKSLFTQVRNTSRTYKADFMLEHNEYARLQTVRTLSVTQIAAIKAINSGNATRQDISTVIGAIKQYAKLTIATGKIADMQSYAVASF